MKKMRMKTRRSYIRLMCQPTGLFQSSLMPSPLFLLSHPYVLPLWMDICDKVYKRVKDSSCCFFLCSLVIALAHFSNQHWILVPGNKSARSVLWCRYDLLCLEGIARALRIFGQKQSVPTFSCKSSLTHSYQRMVVKPEVGHPFQLF